VQPLILDFPTSTTMCLSFHDAIDLSSER
jgi:hypothetical protein